MKLQLLLPLVACMAVMLGCTGPPSSAEVAAAFVYFPPHYKRSDEPRFCFSPAESERAVQEFRKDGSDTLFEVVIDAEGKVVKLRLLRTQVQPQYESDMLEHAHRFGFSPDPKGRGYRAFFLPMQYRYNPSFEWIEPG